MVANWKQKLITLLILLIVISGAMQLMITMQHGNDLQDTYNVAADHENNLRSKRNITYVSAKTTKTTKRKRRKKRKKRKKNNDSSLDHENVKIQSENDPLQTKFKQYNARLTVELENANKDVSELNIELHLLKTENERLKQRDLQSTFQLEELGVSNRQLTVNLKTEQQKRTALPSNQILQPHPAHPAHTPHTPHPAQPTHRTHQTGKLTVDRKNLKAPDGSHNFENWKSMNFNSCAVVGSGPSLLNSGYGTDIDNHDAVFRINSAPTKGFHSDVGSFTTFRVSYGITCLHAAMTGKNSKLKCSCVTIY